MHILRNFSKRKSMIDSNNISYRLREVAASKGGDVGLIEAKSGDEYSFQYLEKTSDQIAWKLREDGVSHTDRVMLMVKPSADFICLTFALFKIGAAVILIDPGMGYKNLLKCIAAVKPKIFIGIPKANIFRLLFKKKFSSIERSYWIGVFLPKFLPQCLVQSAKKDKREIFPIYEPTKEDLAAIIFTTGSTGPPKGVRYEHEIFNAQLEYIQTFYNIRGSDRDQPAFPLFALFSTAIGALAVIPDMDPTKPAKVDAAKFIASLKKYKVTYSFGSPALWNVVSSYCIENDIVLNSLKKVLMAGAPVSGDLIYRTYKILGVGAEIHTPYGATEALPIINTEGKKIVSETWESTVKGYGAYVGKPLPGIDVEIIQISETVIEDMSEDMILPAKKIGEIIVSGNVVTRAYQDNIEETLQAKIIYKEKLWHRMGDIGYKDGDGGIWFCGRKAHRVVTEQGEKYTIPCEAIINNHPDVFRSALVGVKTKTGKETPVMIIEPRKGVKKAKRDLHEEILQLARRSSLTRDIEYILFHKSFPVDIRHNAKIFREKLSLWAQKQLDLQ